MHLNKRDFYLAIASYLFLFSPLLLFFMWTGIKVVGDANYYIESADSLIRSIAAGQSIFHVIKHYDPFYFASISFLAIIKQLSGEHWPVAILFTNAAFYSLCAPAVFLLYRKCGGPRSVVAAAGAAVLPLGYPETLILGYIPLRDVPFAGAAAIAAIAIILLANGEKRPWRFLLAFLLCVVLTLFRPNAIIFFAATASLFAWVCWGWGNMKVRNEWLVLLIQFLLGLGAMVLWAYWLEHPDKIPVPHVEGLLKQIRAINQSGAIIIDHPDLYGIRPETFWDYLWLSWLKLFYYFRYWNPIQSPWHLIYRHIYFGILFANFAYCVLASLTPWGRWFNDNTRKTVFFTISLALAGSTLHATLILAFEFRYQMILFPMIWSLFLLNAAKLASSNKEPRRKQRGIRPFAPQ